MCAWNGICFNLLAIDHRGIRVRVDVWGRVADHIHMHVADKIKWKDKNKALTNHRALVHNKLSRIEIWCSLASKSYRHAL